MIVLDGRSLGVEDAAAVANRAEPVKIAATAMRRMRASREFVEAAMCCSDPVYALNTGVGLLANIRLEESEIEQMQLNLVRSHCCGAGEPMPANVVRGMMLIRANVLGKGLSGIRPVVAERICDLLNHGITPVVPSRGSVGASGDLAPLAHMALVLIGEGFAEYRGRVLPAAECLERVGLEPLTLLGKEGISLLNGTQAMLSYGCLLLARMEALFYSAQTAAAFTMEALRGTTAALDARIHAARPHPGQMLSAAHLLELLEGSGIPRSHGEGGARIQDAYCLRCIPQVHGAYWDALAEARRVFEIELNSATDNPLVFTGDDEFGGDAAIVSGGNFHGAPLALALDQLAIALYQIAGISERRCERLLNPALNEGLPAFLASKPGIESGLMMAQVTAAALVAEIRVLATPASIGSIPTSGNQEDFVSMGMTSALKLAQSVELAETVAGIELMAAVRGLDLRGDVSTAALEAARLAFREAVPAWTEDCVLSGPIGRATEFVTAGGWAADRVASIVAGPRIANDKSAMHRGTERWHEESDGGDPVTYVPVRAARGNVKTAKGWIQEAAKRMLMNNLDPEVAEKPEELIVYGGRGKAARNWECYHKIVETLDRLEDTQTLLVQSGKPVGVLDTHRLAPRVLIANSNLVPKWANWEEFDRLDAAGLMMYGQMTAGSWIYIGTQGILQGTYETFKSAAKQHFNGTLAGTITVTAGLGGMGGAQPLAVKLAGGVSICIEVDATRIKRRLATRYLDKATNSWSEALDMANAAKKDRVPLSIGLLGNAAEILPRMAAMGFVPDLVTDQTSAHDPMWGYLPPSTADEDVNLLRSSKPDEYAARVRTSMAEHVKAILAMQRAGAIAFDYGNNLRTQAKLAGVTEAMEYPGFVPAFIRDSFCEGRGPFRWVALSGDPADIAKTDAALLELFPDDERLQEWLRFASTEIAFQGLPARICWLGYRERDKAGLLFNQMVREGRLAAPIVIGRDHLDAGSVASPFRETEAMLDGSDAVSDWALLNFATGIASGAAWMSFHHGGGVGMGYSQHAGLVAVADGSDEADERLRMCLTNDPAMGVLRHADAGYEKARGVAKARGLDMPSLP